MVYYVIKVTSFERGYELTINGLIQLMGVILLISESINDRQCRIYAKKLPKFLIVNTIVWML